MSEAAFSQLSLELPVAESEVSKPTPQSSSLVSRARLTLGEAARIMREP